MADQPIVWSRHKAGIAAAAGATVVILLRLVAPSVPGLEAPIAANDGGDQFIASMRLLAEVVIGALIPAVAVERMPNRPVPSTGDGA